MNGWNMVLVQNLSLLNMTTFKQLSNSRKNWTFFKCLRTQVTRHDFEPSGDFKNTHTHAREHTHIYICKLKFLIIEKQWISGFQPNDQFYDIGNPFSIIEEATGFLPGIECNRDSASNDQILKVYMCVDISGSNFFQCPNNLVDNCGAKVQFPKF
jgi:ribonuclease T2